VSIMIVRVHAPHKHFELIQISNGTSNRPKNKSLKCDGSKVRGLFLVIFLH